MTSFDDLFEQATKNSEAAATTTKTRNPKLLNISTAGTVYFRFFPDLSTDTPRLNLPYATFGFFSPVTSQNVYGGVCPKNTTGESHYWEKQRGDIWQSGDKDKAKLLYSKERAYANVYVIKDDREENNNETFMVMDYGAKPVDPKRSRSGSPIMKFMHEIIEDEDSEVTKKQLYSLGKDGITIKMVISKDEGSKFPEFKFSVVKKAKGSTFEGFEDKVAKKHYVESASDLSEFLEEPKAEEDMIKLFNQHILGVNTMDQPQGFSNLAPVDLSDEDEEDDIPFIADTEEDDSTPKEKSETVLDTDSEEDFDKMIAGLT